MADYPYPPKDCGRFSEQDYSKIGSSTDCTGLIPSAPHTDAEYDSYREMYSFLPSLPEETTTNDEIV